LTAGNDVEVHDNALLKTLSLPGLTTTFGGVEVWNNPLLESVTMGTEGPLDIGYNLWIDSNASLRFIDAPGATDARQVWVAGNPALERLALPALQNVQYVDLYMNGTTGTPLVLDLTTLPTTGKDIDIDSNPGLENLDFRALTQTGAGLWINNNPDLRTLSFPALTRVNGWLEIDGNTSVSSFALPVLDWAGGWFIVDNMPSLTTFSAPALSSVWFVLEIASNAALASFDLGALESIGPPTHPNPTTWIDLRANPALTSFDLSGLAVVGSLNIDDNDGLLSLPDLSSLDPRSDVVLSANDALVDVDGLSGVAQLGTMRLDSNPALTDLTGLSSLTRATYLQLWGNTGLASVSFPNLDRVDWNLELLNNPSVTSVAAPLLTHIGDGAGPSSGAGNLYLNGNPLLNSASLPTLATLDSRLQVVNSDLANLNGISSITSPVFEVNVSGNPSLTDVAGLAGLGTTNDSKPAVSGDFRIINNGALRACDAAGVLATIKGRNPIPATAVLGSVDVNTGNLACGGSGFVAGNPIEFPSSGSHSPNFLLGSPLSVTTTTTLTHLAVIGKAAGPQFQLALYTDVAGNPGTLIASTPAQALAVGVQEIAVTPTALPAGTYWFMGIYQSTAGIGLALTASAVVKYISLSFGSALPTTFPPPTTYTGQEFNYYIRVTDAQAASMAAGAASKVPGEVDKKEASPRRR